MYCNKCGNKINDEMRFCSKCGNYIGDNYLKNNTTSNNKPNNLNNNNLKNSNNNSNIKNNNYKTYNPNKKNKSSIGIIIGILAVLAAIVLFFIIAFIIVIALFLGSAKKSNNVYSDDESYNNSYTNNNVNNSNNNSNSNNSSNTNSNTNNNTNNTATSKSKNRKSDETAIETENTYKGLNIKSINDATEIIKKDSEDQKIGTTSEEVKKIENNIINKYKITAVNLGEIDVQFAKELENVLDVLYKEYPEVKEYLTNLSITNYTPHTGTIAYFQPFFPFTSEKTRTTLPWTIKTRISLIDSYFLNESKLENTVKMGSAAGHFPKNATKYSPLAHEFGHYVSFIALLKEKNVSSVKYMNNVQDVNKLVEISNDFKNREFFTKNAK